MITTDYAPGAPCFLDLGAPDVPAAAAFYSSVFGWDYEAMEGENGDGGNGQDMEGGMFRKNGKIVAGLGKLTEKGARPAWMIYYSVPDADATTQAVERAGGSVRVAPTDLDEWGRMAQYTDPLGGQFAVWQSGTSKGAELVDEPGSLCWTELMTTDVAASKEFYTQVFGWRYTEMGMPGDGGTYHMITPAGQPEERMHGGMMQLGEEDLALNQGRPYWHPVFAVDDCDAAVATATENGGTVQMGPEDAEGVGRLAVCLDRANADFVVLDPSQG
ncbi:VOC family protein [Streptomyces sp. SBST2-5]|uniref:VOC family protein n=1 Tax=Streptomyces composti TaxID=2720025 RepID=A0ABX1A9Y5_9ACTN|nr:VOC family protein [Streptomyces composti]NJP51842.1 VOC family protein [Streptomyces composti]